MGDRHGGGRLNAGEDTESATVAGVVLCPRHAVRHAQNRTREQHIKTQNKKITIHTNHSKSTRYIAGVGPLNNINERGPHYTTNNVQSSVVYNNPN